MTGSLQAYKSTKSNEELQYSINANVRKLKFTSCEYVRYMLEILFNAFFAIINMLLIALNMVIHNIIFL